MNPKYMYPLNLESQRISGVLHLWYFIYGSNLHRERLEIRLKKPWDLNKTFSLVCIGLVLLFQPFFKIALGRELWNLIDVILAVFL
jgi:hypothetical protein